MSLVSNNPAWFTFDLSSVFKGDSYAFLQTLLYVNVYYKNKQTKKITKKKTSQNGLHSFRNLSVHVSPVEGLNGER